MRDDRHEEPVVPGESVLDPEIVDQLQALTNAGNAGLLHKLQASFARDTPIRLHALRAAVEAGDTKAVAFNIHILRGSAANLGATEIVATCRLLEEAPAVIETWRLEPLLAELERSADRAQAELARLAARDA